MAPGLTANGLKDLDSEGGPTTKMGAEARLPPALKVVRLELFRNFPFCIPSTSSPNVQFAPWAKLAMLKVTAPLPANTVVVAHPAGLANIPVGLCTNRVGPKLSCTVRLVIGPVPTGLLFVTLKDKVVLAPSGIAVGKKDLVKAGGSSTSKIAGPNVVGSLVVAEVNGPAVNDLWPAGIPLMTKVILQDPPGDKVSALMPTWSEPPPGGTGTPPATPQPLVPSESTFRPTGKMLSKLIFVSVLSAPGFLIVNRRKVVVLTGILPTPKDTLVRMGCASATPPAPSIIIPAIPTIKRNLLSMLMRSTPF